MAAGGKLLTPAEVAAKLPSAANPEVSDMVDRMLLRLLASSLKNAIELGLLETLMAAGSKLLTPAEVAAKLPSVANREAADMVDHMLRLLASYNVVSCTVEEGKDSRLSRLYGAAPVCKFLTRKEDSFSMSALVLMNQEKVLMESCNFTGGVPAEAVVEAGGGGGGRLQPKFYRN